MAVMSPSGEVGGSFGVCRGCKRPTILCVFSRSQHINYQPYNLRLTLTTYVDCAITLRTRTTETRLWYSVALGALFLSNVCVRLLGRVCSVRLVMKSKFTDHAIRTTRGMPMLVKSSEHDTL